MNDDAARMVEVGDKDVTDRVAVASCVLEADASTIERLVEGTPKGDPIEAARIAGLMAVKRTPDLLPFCHPVAITGAEVVVQPDPGAGRVAVTVTVRATDRTGVEMEAMMGAAVAALALYDAAKAFQRSAHIADLRLVEKRGGAGGDFRAP
jgi:cyclic pyranopterin monophosphate synthase